MTKVVRTLEDNLIMALGVVGLVVNSLIFLLFPYLWLVPVATVFFNIDPIQYLGLIQISLLGISTIIFIGTPYLITAHFKQWGLLTGLAWGFMNFLAAMIMDHYHHVSLTGVSGLEPYTSASSELFFSTFFVTLTLPAVLGYFGERKQLRIARQALL